MVQKSEELRGSGTAPYSDALCAVVSLHGKHWSDQTMPRLHPLQLIANTYMVTCTLQVSSLCMLLHIILVVGWAYF